MRGVSDKLIHIVLNALYFSGVYRVMEPATAGRGVIFMLHRVRPATSANEFAPNRILEVTPEFLDSVLTLLRARNIEVVTLDEAVARLKSPSGGRFAAFTFDDGYADNLDIALPVFEAHRAPFTIYIATGLADATADIWWLLLEEAIKHIDAVRITIGGQHFHLPARNPSEKQAAWDGVYWPLRDVTIAERHDAVAGLAADAGVSAQELFTATAANWDRLRKAAGHGLVELGAHTVHHLPLSALAPEEARREIQDGRRRLEENIGRTVRHFAYPFGDAKSASTREFALARELGFATAVTGRPGPLFPEHAEKLHALPRVSLNGNYQSPRYVKLFLSGAPFALYNRIKKPAAA